MDGMGIGGIWRWKRNIAVVSSLHAMSLTMPIVGLFGVDTVR
jgi:hypothetical protein